MFEKIRMFMDHYYTKKADDTYPCMRNDTFVANFKKKYDVGQ